MVADGFGNARTVQRRIGCVDVQAHALDALPEHDGGEGLREIADEVGRVRAGGNRLLEVLLAKARPPHHAPALDDRRPRCRECRFARASDSR